MRCVWIFCVLVLVAGEVRAGMATLFPVADTSLYDTPNGVSNPISNGAGEFLFAGNTGVNNDFETRRALMAFDVAGSIPVNAVVESAILQLTVTMSPPAAGSDPFTMHRGLAAWGEGASNPTGNEGRGTTAAAGDASWAFREVPGMFWATPGGDFIGGASASASIGTQGLPYLITGPGLAADVQQWLDDPGSNFGWFLLGDESGNQSVRQFGSRESGDPDSRPTLMVSYRVVPEPAVVWLMGVGAGVLWWRRRRR